MYIVHGASKVFAASNIGVILFLSVACSADDLGKNITEKVVEIQVSPLPGDVAASSTLEFDTSTSTVFQEMLDTKITVVEGSVVRYIVREQLAGRSLPNDAVGKTTDVDGIIWFDSFGIVKPGSEIQVDLRQLKSDENRRDRFVRRNTLETHRFPFAKFIVMSVHGLDWPISSGSDFNFDLQGTMMIHGVTKPVTWKVNAISNGDTLRGIATTEFVFELFDIDIPRVFVVLSVENKIRLELEFITTISRDDSARGL